MTVLDLGELASRRTEAAELARRIEQGDLAAAFDASVFLEAVDRITADLCAFLAQLEPQDDRLAFAADDGLHHVIGFVSGASELAAALDDSRDRELDDEP